MLLPLSTDRVSPIGLSHTSPARALSLGSSPRSAAKAKRALTFTRSRHERKCILPVACCDRHVCSYRIPVRSDSISRSQESVQSSSSLSQSPKQGQSREMSADEMLSSSSSASDLEPSSKLPTGHSPDGHQTAIVMADGAWDSGVESLAAEAVEAVKLSMECHVSELKASAIVVQMLCL